MKLRKITVQEYNCATVARTTKHATPAVKVFNGSTKIVDRLFTINAGTYKWLILVPHELLSDLNWNEIFRRGLKNKAIRNGDTTPVKVNYTTYITENDGVLFAFK